MGFSFVDSTARAGRMRGLSAAGVLRGHFLLDGGHETGVDILRDRTGFHAFVDLDGFLRGISDYPAIRAFRKVPFELGPDLPFGLFVEEIAQLGKEFLTCKQRRRLLCV